MQRSRARIFEGENGGDAAADEAVWPLETLRPYPCLARTGAKG
jgi:hypothetical protein